MAGKGRGHDHQVVAGAPQGVVLLAGQSWIEHVVQQTGQGPHGGPGGLATLEVDLHIHPRGEGDAARRRAVDQRGDFQQHQPLSPGDAQLGHRGLLQGQLAGGAVDRRVEGEGGVGKGALDLGYRRLARHHLEVEAQGLGVDHQRQHPLDGHTDLGSHGSDEQFADHRQGRGADGSGGIGAGPVEDEKIAAPGFLPVDAETGNPYFQRDRSVVGCCHQDLRRRLGLVIGGDPDLVGGGAGSQADGNQQCENETQWTVRAHQDSSRSAAVCGRPCQSAAMRQSSPRYLRLVRYIGDC